MPWPARSRGRVFSPVSLHWDLRGNPNGFGSPVAAVLAGPLVLLALWGLFELLPRVDPRLARPAAPGQTEHERRGALSAALASVVVLAACMHGALLARATGILGPDAPLLALLVGAFFVVFGNFAGQLRPGWFVGIRTPWTLSSDDVWRRRTGWRVG